jgi:hypothetical protein
MGRPALATQRLERTKDGRIVYRLRRRWRDGTSTVVFELRELLARLAAQVPPPRAHQVRDHGILAPSAQWRAFVIPRPSSGCEQDSDCCPPKSSTRAARGRARRMAWSELLPRVFAVDALQCDRCGGRMRVMAAIRAPASIVAFLAAVALADRAPPAQPQVRATKQVTSVTVGHLGRLPEAGRIADPCALFERKRRIAAQERRKNLDLARAGALRRDRKARAGDKCTEWNLSVLNFGGREGARHFEVTAYSLYPWQPSLRSSRGDSIRFALSKAKHRLGVGKRGTRASSLLGSPLLDVLAKMSRDRSSSP